MRCVFTLLVIVAAIFSLPGTAFSEAIAAFCTEGSVPDCLGTCGGNAVYDECKVCTGPGKTSDNGGARCCPDELNRQSCCGGREKGCDEICGSGKKFDACGVCGGSGMGTDSAGDSCCGFNDNGCCGKAKKGCDGICGSGTVFGCDGVCNSGRTDKGCGCGVLSCSNCVWMAQWADWTDAPSIYGDPGALVAGRNNFLLYNFLKSIPANAGIPGCFSDRFKDACKHSEKKSGNTPSGVADTQIYGVCKRSDGKGFNWNDMAEFLGTTADAAKYKEFKVHHSFQKSDYILFPDGCGGSWQYTQFCGDLTGYSRYTWFMDENCKAVHFDRKRPVCGYVGTSWSPISLIWEPGHSLTSNMRVVKFPLSDDLSKPYSMWKASAKAPLLVYDPQHTGTVTSARQLFGSIALGGMTTKVSDFSSDVMRKSWANGYEALGLLDSDHDDKISGSELEPLALWFDVDQDAVVDTGELRSLKDVLVTALFYKNPTKIGSEKDVGLSVGFERNINGVTQVGESIDWYSDVFSSEKEAADMMLALAGSEGFKPMPGTKYEERIEEWMTRPLEFKPGTPRSDSSDVSGFWVWWQEDQKHGEMHPGAFVLRQFNDGSMKGFSVVEAMLQDNPDKYRSSVRPLPAVGSVKKSSDGKTVVGFSVLDQFARPTARSTAELSADGLTLRGTTDQTATFTKDGKEQTATVRYSWKATKFQN